MSENKEKQQVEEKEDDFFLLKILLIMGAPLLIIGLVLQQLPNKETFGDLPNIFLIISYVLFGLAGLCAIELLYVKIFPKIKQIKLNKNKIIWSGLGVLLVGWVAVKNTTNSLPKNVWCGEYLSSNIGIKKDAYFHIAKEDVVKGRSEYCGRAFNKQSALVVINFPNEHIAKQWDAYDKQLIVIKGDLEEYSYPGNEGIYFIDNPRFVNYAN